MIGALTIGQAPRVDLVGPLQTALPKVEIRQVGALDLLSVPDLPDVSGAAYPLGTRMRDGTAVFVAESFLLPHLQQQLDRLEADGAVATALLCAGTFAGLRGKRPLFKPFDFAKATLQTLGISRISVHTPFEQQIAPISARWASVGFEAATWAAPFLPETDRFQQQATHAVSGRDALVLDYVGHPETAVLRLQAALKLPVLDLGMLLVRGITAVML